jgi:DNA-binding IclR family transcriptional regulator
MKHEPYPAPALARGLHLLEQLARDGQLPLEQLAARNQWPKSSTLRYLQTLEQLHLVRQDNESRHWTALRKLSPIGDFAPGCINTFRKILPHLAEASGHCTELYSIQGRHIELVDRADPESSSIRLLARIGHVRDLSELDSTAALFYAFTQKPPPQEMWQWKSGLRTNISPLRRDQKIKLAESQSVVIDDEFNENGIRRFSIPILQSSQLIGLISIAQRQTPLAERETSNLTTLLSTSNSLNCP